MSFNPNDGFVAAAPSGDVSGVDELPIFNVERAQMAFSVTAEFVAAQIANNVMILALSNGRILRIDLKRPEDIDGKTDFGVTLPCLNLKRQVMTN